MVRTRRGMGDTDPRSSARADAGANLKPVSGPELAPAAPLSSIIIFDIYY